MSHIRYLRGGSILKWKFAENNDQKIETYSKNLKISPILATIFVNRNVDINTANALIHNAYGIIEKPVNIANMDRAVDFLMQCIKEKRPVHIFADYDCDGLTAGYIMSMFVNQCEDTYAEVYYPERIEKYGLSKTYCNKLIKRYSDSTIKPLVITVDNGITKKEEVRLLRNNGFAVLITDHHLVDPNLLPEDCVILDPYLGDSKIGRNLCGAGVAWNLCRAVEERVARNHNFTNGLLYAATIGTLADIMPLDTYNLALTMIGIAVMNSEQAPNNIKMYLKHCCKSGVIDSDEISWTLAPMLNACGRMGDVQLGANFLFETNETRLIDILSAINKLNTERKKIEYKAIEEVEKELNPDTEVICVDGHKYPVGIHGLIAGKISQKYDKPSIVLNQLPKENIYVGSCRSNTVPLNTLMNHEKKAGNLLSFGGHAFAGGISLYKSKESDLVDSLSKMIRKMKDNGTYDQYIKEPAIQIDAILKIRDINNSIRNKINAYAYDNKTFRRPTWAFLNLKVKNIVPSNAKPKNLKFTLSDGRHSIDIWGWDIRDKYEEIGKPDKVDIAGQITTNFLKQKQTTLRIVDIRASE